MVALLKFNPESVGMLDDVNRHTTATALTITPPAAGSKETH